MVPSTVAMPRDGSLALASRGSVRKVQEASLSAGAGRRSLALKKIVAAGLGALVVCTGGLLDGVFFVAFAGFLGLAMAVHSAARRALRHLAAYGRTNK